jgi:hypothetical protein
MRKSSKSGDAELSILRRNPSKPMLQYIVVAHDPSCDLRPSCRGETPKLQEEAIEGREAFAPGKARGFGF